MENSHKKIINAWAMYDWANSAFATTIMGAVLPVYYASVAAAGLPGNTATVYWAYTTSISLLIAAIASPILGALADFSGTKKRLLAIFAFIGIVGTALLYFVKTGDWLMASLFFIVANLALPVHWSSTILCFPILFRLKIRKRWIRYLPGVMRLVISAAGYCWRSTWP